MDVVVQHHVYLTLTDLPTTQFNCLQPFRDAKLDRGVYSMNRFVDLCVSVLQSAETNPPHDFGLTVAFHDVAFRRRQIAQVAGLVIPLP